MVGGRLGGGMRRRGDSSCPRLPQARARFVIVGLLICGLAFFVWPHNTKRQRPRRSVKLLQTPPRVNHPSIEEERPPLKIDHQLQFPEEENSKENDRVPLGRLRSPGGTYDPRGDSSDPLEKSEVLQTAKQAKTSVEERKEHEDQDHRGDSKDPINAVERPHDLAPKVNNDPRGDSKDPVNVNAEKPDEESPGDSQGKDSSQNLDSGAKKKSDNAHGAQDGAVSHSQDVKVSKVENKKDPARIGKEADSKSVGPDSAEDQHRNSNSDEAVDNGKISGKLVQPLASIGAVPEAGVRAKMSAAAVKEAHAKAGDMQTEAHMHVEQADLEKSKKWDSVQGPHPNSALEEANSEHMKERHDETHAQYKWLEGKVTAPTAKEQQAAVQKMIKHAWDSYVKYAWGSNELQPMLQAGKDDQASLGNAAIGAALLEALDTLYLAGLEVEYLRGREWVAQDLQFSKMTGDVSLSEVTSRLLASLLSLYALTGDEMYKEHALDLSASIMAAFPHSALPHISTTLNQTQFDNDKGGGSCFLLGEYGSFHLEFAYLSQMTQKSNYLDTVEHVRDVLTRPKNAKLPGMPALRINAQTAEAHLDSGADTYYEYLIKSYFQSKGHDHRALTIFKQMAESAKEHMLKEREIGKVRYRYLARSGTTKMSHAACYAGEMFGLASVALNRTEMLEIGEALALTCHEMYSQMASKLGAEEVQFHQGRALSGGSLFDIVDPTYQLRPEAVESYFVLWRLTHNQVYRDWAWEVAQAIEKYCRTDNGYVAVKDVNHPGSPSDGVQHAAFLAATLKYLYLIFSNDSLVPLDKWVFNTEGHPLPVYGAFGDRVSGLMKRVVKPSVKPTQKVKSVKRKSDRSSRERDSKDIGHSPHSRHARPPGNRGIVGKQRGHTSFKQSHPHQISLDARGQASQQQNPAGVRNAVVPSRKRSRSQSHGLSRVSALATGQRRPMKQVRQRAGQSAAAAVDGNRQVKNIANNGRTAYKRPTRHNQRQVRSKWAHQTKRQRLFKAHHDNRRL